jgi:hypothetical protein
MRALDVILSAGYDMVTGIGVPNVKQLISAPP